MTEQTKETAKNIRNFKKISSFQERLNKELYNQDITQYRLAKITGIPQTTMSNYCCGLYEPKRENLTQIANLLQVQEMWLLGYDVPRQIDKKCEEEIVSKLKLMDSSDLEKINKIMDIFMTFGED